jgi:streptomycin 6-kinase
MSIRPLAERVEELIQQWGILIQNTLDTQSSLIIFGRRGDKPVVLKVVRQPGDEWRSGEVLDVFGGSGTVRVYDYVEGAVLLEKLNPGTPLTTLALAGRDEEATEILAGVIQKMSNPRETSKAFVTAQDWGKSFERYQASGDNQIPNDLVTQARQTYMELCASQRAVRLLHGDLQHYNVLFDSERGWVAIDPKGVEGEVEYEIGAALRNPYERPELFASPEIVERRIKRYAARLKLDACRALSWGFSQAVLSSIWSVEDGFAVDNNNPSLRLAVSIRQILSS